MRFETVCSIQKLVATDPRFELHQTAVRSGVYFNFESVLERVPAAAAYVALADQDDVWAPDKLATLMAATAGGAVLAYSDQRIVDAEGQVLSSTFWAQRTNYSTGLRRMLAGNTVTGAATLFRRDLLPFVLPFPPRLGGSYHDHWLAVVALAAGRLAYVDRPLYDYVQHPGQVLGHGEIETASDQNLGRRRWTLSPRLLLASWQDRYFDRVLPQRLFATVLLLRFGNALAEPDRRILAAVAEADTSRRGTVNFLLRGVFERRKETLGYQRQAVFGILWRVVAVWKGRRATPRKSRRQPWRFRDDQVDYGPERSS